MRNRVLTKCGLDTRSKVLVGMHLCEDVILTPWAQPLYPPPPCISHALVQATVGVGTVIILYVI